MYICNFEQRCSMFVCSVSHLFCHLEYFKMLNDYIVPSAGFLVGNFKTLRFSKKKKKNFEPHFQLDLGFCWTSKKFHVSNLRTVEYLTIFIVHSLQQNDMSAKDMIVSDIIYSENVFVSKTKC